VQIKPKVITINRYKFFWFRIEFIAVISLSTMDVSTTGLLSGIKLGMLSLSSSI